MYLYNFGIVRICFDFYSFAVLIDDVCIKIFLHLDAVRDRATGNAHRVRTGIDRAAEVDPATVSEAVRSISGTAVEAVPVKKRKNECANRGKSKTNVKNCCS